MIPRFKFSASIGKVLPSLLRPCNFPPLVSVSNYTYTRGRVVSRIDQKFIQNLGSHKIKIKTKLQSVKNFSKENILTLPNAISLARLLATPGLGYLILNNNHMYATGIFVVLCVSDLVDGYIARNVNGQSSIFGSIIDPVADKLMIGTATITLGIVGLLPLPLVILYISRDVGLVLFGAYLRYISLPPPVTLKQFFNLKLKTVEATPSYVSKINTVLQALLITTSLLAEVFEFSDSSVFPFLWYLTATTTVWSSVDYLCFKSGYRMIRRKRRKK
ncbi:hypothetical protein LOD99_4259 [Oopsacas minuta]|uniref:cardiolipin synthase (CMP-forming) n=1 Tax=Oopsacas minuta TaxID=111878 RepID=A0AAV7JV21_9METZ|nr:hypothetical protein LOD99_4259 [Oopsacas minuta]